jgi:PAS domain S-box-containing protein
VESWRELWASYDAIIEAFGGFVYVVSKDYEIEFMNKRFIERAGSYPLGRKCYEVLHHRDQTCPWCLNEKVFRGETVHREWFNPEDNRWYHMINTPIPHSGAGISSMVMMRDITARKETEENLRRTTRALKTLSECVHTLVRATDESCLINDMCRIIVETGGYRLAWVGFAEQDEDKTVRPVGSAGFEAGYLESVNISWADSELGRGPTGVAIRTGKPSLCKNMLMDPNYAPWRAEALKRGYASSIALPLIAAGRPFGALNIYAPEPDAFDAEELHLLRTLAEDLAYGITALRTSRECTAV